MRKSLWIILLGTRKRIGQGLRLPTRVRFLSPVLLLLFLLPLPLFADTTYTYTGTQFTSCFGTYIATCSTHSDSGSFATTLSQAQLQNLTDYSISLSDISSFSFSDGGLNSITNASPNLKPSTFFLISTDASGNLTQWVIGLYVSPPTGSQPYGAYIETLNPPGRVIDDSFHCDLFNSEGNCVGASGGDTSETGTTGTWTQSSSTVPEPSSLLLLGSGLAAFAGVIRRKLTK